MSLFMSHKQSPTHSLHKALGSIIDKILNALNCLKTQPLRTPTPQNDSIPFSGVCCSHCQAGDLNCCQASWPLKTSITVGEEASPQVMNLYRQRDIVL